MEQVSSSCAMLAEFTLHSSALDSICRETSLKLQRDSISACDSKLQSFTMFHVVPPNRSYRRATVFAANSRASESRAPFFTNNTTSRDISTHYYSLFFLPISSSFSFIFFLFLFSRYRLLNLFSLYR